MQANVDNQGSCCFIYLVKAKGGNILLYFHPFCGAAEHAVQIKVDFLAACCPQSIFFNHLFLVVVKSADVFWGVQLTHL